MTKGALTNDPSEGMFAVEINEAELIVRLIEAGIEKGRPDFMTAEEILALTRVATPEPVATATRQARAAIRYFRELLENAEPLQ